MKKLKTQLEVEKSEKKKKLVIGGILIFLMLFSTAGFAFSSLSGLSTSSSETNQDNYFNGQYWVYQRDRDYLFTHHASEIEFSNLNFNKNLADYYNSNIYIDSESQEVFLEIASNLGNIASKIQQGCYGECEEDLPEKTCEENIIIWRPSEEESITEEKNCVFINGDLKTVDGFLYTLLGIN